MPVVGVGLGGMARFGVGSLVGVEKSGGAIGMADAYYCACSRGTPHAPAGGSGGAEGGRRALERDDWFWAWLALRSSIS